MSHTYSTDSSERRYIPFGIAATAIAASFLVSHLTGKYQIEFPWWASPPVDTMAFYGFFYFLFDRYLWKWKLLHWFRIVKLPDLSGEWRGHVIPTPTAGVSAGLAAQADISVSVRQSWATILISARTTSSRSHSVSAAITVSNEVSLSYQFVNEPAASAAATMHTHRGTVTLLLDKAGSLLDGDYYSGRDRQNIGTMRVSRAGTKKKAP